MKRIFALFVVLLVLTGGLPALADAIPGGNFRDDNGNTHEPNIEAIRAAGVTQGCNPPENNLYCPDGTVTRGQMAAFLRRAFALPVAPKDYFADDAGHLFEADINALAAAGITQGCNPPIRDKFCPDQNVTRGQMAAFLKRAFSYPAAGTDYFTDDDGNLFEADIQAIRAAGVTMGCNPPDNDEYCPNALVKRDQMASFLARALGLAPLTPFPVITFGPGTHLVTEEIWEGRYAANASPGCYAERLSGLGGTFDEIIANTFLSQPSRIIVELSGSEAAFSTDQECGVWTNDIIPRPNPGAPFGNGHWYTFVGGDVEAGIWRNSDSSGGCYWERLSGFSWTLADIKANDFTYSIATVSLGSEAGFYSDDCGTWTKIG